MFVCFSVNGQIKFHRIEYNIEYKQMLLIWNSLTINPDDYLCQGGIDPARIVRRSLPDSVCNPCPRLQVTHPNYCPITTLTGYCYRLHLSDLTINTPSF